MDKGTGTRGTARNIRCGRYVSTAGIPASMTTCTILDRTLINRTRRRPR